MMMRWISFSLFGAALASFGLGCASTPLMDAKFAELSAQNERLAKQVSVIQAERRAQGQQPAPEEQPKQPGLNPLAAPGASAPMPLVPVLMQPHYGEGCGLGYDVVIDNANHSGESIELQGDKFVPCSLNGIAQIQTPDGRWIFLVQDGSQARFAYLGRGAFKARLIGYDRLLWDAVSQRHVATPNGRSQLIPFSGASTGLTGAWLVKVMSGDLR